MRTKIYTVYTNYQGPLIGMVLETWKEGIQSFSALFDLQKEIVTVHVGQAGIQIGQNFWEALCNEHGIKMNGQAHRGGPKGNPVFFRQLNHSLYSPRAVMVDTDDVVLDELQNGLTRGLFLEKNSYKACQCLGGATWSRAFTQDSQNSLPNAGDGIRLLAESCDGLQGFMFFHSMGGGTGSGCSSSLMEGISSKFAKTPLVDLSVFPSSKMTNLIVEPYNTILFNHATLSDGRCSFLLDNVALSSILKNKLHCNNPTFKDLNTIVAHSLSSLTSSLRYRSALFSSLGDYMTNLIPFPRMKYNLWGYSPVMTPESAMCEPPDSKEITRGALSPGNQLLCVDPRKGVHLSCCLIYRGDVSPLDVSSVITEMKAKGWPRFAPWSSKTFKIGITNNIPCQYGSTSAFASRSCCSMSNSTAIVSPLVKLYNKASAMFNMRAFLHWYAADGTEFDTFVEAIESMKTLICDYIEASKG